MRDPKFKYLVSVRIPLTLAEHAHLMNLSRQHYDRMCREISQEGRFLHGWECKIKYGGPGPGPDDSGVVYATWGELDTLCKVCEMDRANSVAPNPALCGRIRGALDEVTREHKRANGMQPNDVVFHASWPRDKTRGQKPGETRTTVTFEGWWDTSGTCDPAVVPAEVLERFRSTLALSLPRGAQVRTQEEYLRWQAGLCEDEPTP